MIGTSEKNYPKFFIQKNSEYYTIRDIYNEDGMLLLSKGQKISMRSIKKLEKFIKREFLKDLDHTSKKQNAPLTSEEKRSETLAPILNNFKKRFGIKDERVLEKPNKVLSSLIFESRTEPWWIYVRSLSNYVAWMYTHSVDVALISMMMANELGYNDEGLYNIGLGALLHDIGKLLIPKPVFEKPEELSKIEIDCVRQHCELGKSSLEGFDLPNDILDIVMQHHEKLDGSGYPSGLKEDEISYNAKIVMIADTIDAITSYRPYRKPQSIDTAIKILKEEGEKYSQILLTVLINLLKK